PRGHPDAIVRPKAARDVFQVSRFRPDESLAEFVDYYWLVRWNPADAHRQQVVPQPRVHLAGEDGRLLVHGINRESFFRTLTGPGHVLGAAFHPAGFRPLLRSGLGSISGTVRPAGELLGVDDRDTASRIDAAEDAGEMITALQEYLQRVDPQPDPTARRVTELVGVAERDTSISRAEHLAVHAGTSLRTLQ